MAQTNPLSTESLWENTQRLERFEDMTRDSNQAHPLTQQHIDEIYRILTALKHSHTLSQAQSLNQLAQAAESALLRLQEAQDTSYTVLHKALHDFVVCLKSQSPRKELLYKAHLQFEADSQMEGVRAFAVVHALGGSCSAIAHLPADLEAPDAAAQIQKNGFTLHMLSEKPLSCLQDIFEETLFLESCKIEECPENAVDMSSLFPEMFCRLKDETRSV